MKEVTKRVVVLEHTTVVDGVTMPAGSRVVVQPGKPLNERAEGAFLNKLSTRDTNDLKLMFSGGAVEIHKVEVTQIQGQKALALRFTSPDGPNVDLFSVTFTTVADQPYITWSS